MKKNLISFLLMFIGITLILSALSFKLYFKHKEVVLIREFNEKLKEEKLKDKEKTTNDNKENEDNNSIKELGIIEIPSIGLQSIIVEGTEMDKLRFYLGHFSQTANAGEEGNFCIAGHSSTIYNEILNNLHKVNAEDIIKIKTLKGEIKYSITKKFVVEPTEVSVLDNKKGEKTMTIVTCTDSGKKRLIVTADEIN